jgi:colanic acid/amylovoran biosynthesis glycosyltransferase
MEVLQLFSLYLSQTMNWAPRLLIRVGGVKMHVGAGFMAGNDYRQADWQFVMPWYQSKPAASDVNKPFLAHGLSAIDKRFFGGYERQLVKYSLKNNIKIWHAHFANVGCRYMQAAEKANAKLIVSFYGVDYAALLQRKPSLRGEYAKMFERAAAIVCEGPFGADTLVRMGCPKEKIHIIPFGVAPLAPADQQPHMKQPGSLNLIQLATITAKKGHLDTIEAIKLALPSCPNLKLTFVGEVLDKKLHQQLKQRIAAYGLSSVVTWGDLVPYGHLDRLMSGFDALIQPSCHAADGDCEGGAPVVILDAQRAGLPIITTDHCDIPFLVRQNQSALIAHEGDSATLAEHIKTMYNLSELDYQAMSEIAIRGVHLDFNIGVSGQKLFRLYELV